MRDDLAPQPLPRLPPPGAHRSRADAERDRGGSAARPRLRARLVVPEGAVRVRGLVGMQDEIQREYGNIAVVTVDEPYVNGAFRAGLGADFPFLSDEDRAVAEVLDLLGFTDEWHRPYLPLTRARLAPADPRGLVRLLVLGEPDARRATAGAREITRSSSRATNLRPVDSTGAARTSTRASRPR